MSRNRGAWSTAACPCGRCGRRGPPGDPVRDRRLASTEVDPHPAVLVEVAPAVVPVAEEPSRGVERAERVDEAPASSAATLALGLGHVRRALERLGDQTSRSSGATLKSPRSTTGSVGAYVAAIQSWRCRATRACARRTRCRPRGRSGTYTLITFTPPHVGGEDAGVAFVGSTSSSVEPEVTSSTPTRDRIATPFHWPGPVVHRVVARASGRSARERSSASLVSWRHRTSGSA